MHTDDMWQILGTFPSNNGQFKVTARRGSAVVQMDRLTAEQAAEVTPEAVQSFWLAGRTPPAPHKCSVSA